jgi:glycosyltransferase involved in cell wall biosynthesis
MKILMVHPHDLFDLSEPWTIRIKSIARKFLKKGHKIKLAYFPLNPKELKSKFIWEGIEIIPLDRRRGINKLIKNTLVLIKEAEWANIIHFQKCFHYASIPTVLAAWIKKKPIHYDWDDWETKIYFYGKPASPFVGLCMWILERAIPKFADTVSLSSRRLFLLCTDEYGVSPKRTTRAPVGADLELFRPDISGVKIRRKYRIDGPLILYLGQLHGAQYAELFIRASREVVNWHPESMFLVVGGGYRLEELRKLTYELGMIERIIFTNFVPHEEIPYYIASADVCVACFENNDITQCKSPLKLTEYLAMEKAIVASNVGEVRNMVGGAGLLVKPGDYLVLAGAINKLLSRPDLRYRMQSLARKRAENKYNWEYTSDNLLEIYEKILAGYERGKY